MTVIRNNSISGINSITAQSASLNFYDTSGNTLSIGASVSGNITGDVTGNVTGNLTGDVNAGVITATSSIVVGDKFISSAGVGIGTTDTAGRNAGVGTAIGTLIFNTTTNSLEGFGEGGWKVVKSFTSLDIEMMLIGGGGGGGGDQSGGGGAGALVYTNSITLLSGDTPLSISVGTGGASTPTTTALKAGLNGGDSTFGTSYTASGGGGGNTNPGTYDQPGAGGSGGGGSYYVNAGGTATGASGGTGDSTSPSAGWGHDGGSGGTSDPALGGGGGGGAGGVGGNIQGPRIGSAGGVGLNYSITGSSVGYAGGGGGYGDFTPGPDASAPFGGGRSNAAPTSPQVPTSSIPGVDGKGGGGGACRYDAPAAAPNPATISDGGDGVCIIAYVGTSSRLTFNPGASVSTSTVSRSGYVVHTISAPTAITEVSAS